MNFMKGLGNKCCEEECVEMTIVYRPFHSKLRSTAVHINNSVKGCSLAMFIPSQYEPRGINKLIS